MAETTATRRRSRLQDRVYRIIFESDTPAGRGFDILLILSIVGSVVAVMLDSVPGIRAAAGGVLSTAEWAFTILFTVEYVLRLYSAPRPAALRAQLLRCHRPAGRWRPPT